MLIPSYRRQATVLKLAYSHAIMHASRLFLLGSSSTTSGHAEDCISAAKDVLELVDYMAREGPIFHAFWWTHYVTFCALVVIYVWEIQQRRKGTPIRTEKDHRTKLLELAEKCHMHLARATATNSPSRRYAVILEEFRNAARTQQPPKKEVDVSFTRHHEHQTVLAERQYSGSVPNEFGQVANSESEQPLILDPHLLDEWQTTDWLELDSSVCWFSFIRRHIKY